MDAQRWTVPHDHPAFAGHFPGRPIVPGVVLLDHAIRLATDRYELEPATLRLGNAKFLSPVAPGETLEFSLQQKASGSIQFDVHSGERHIATGLLTARAEDAT